MAFVHKENTGSVFENDRKDRESQPDRTGKANIGGVEYWVNGWINKTESGDSYLKLSFQKIDDQEIAREELADNARRDKANEDADEIPF